jgi:hypothetical protein
VKLRGSNGLALLHPLADKELMRGCAVVAACVWLIGCGGTGGAANGGAGGQPMVGGAGGQGTAGAAGNHGAAGASGGSATGGAGGSVAGAGGASGGSSGAAGAITLRVAHTFLQSGKTTGPALDIYDDMYNGGPQASASGKPLIAGLAYGKMSSYVKPRFVDLGGTAVRLMALPAGSPSTDFADAIDLWGDPDDGSHPQLTVQLVGESLSDATPLAGLAYHAWIEKGNDVFSGAMGPLAPPPPAGQGEYLVSGSDAIATEPVGGFSTYFFVDDDCTPPLNGDTNLPGVPLVAIDISVSSFALFPAAPGPHAISLVATTGSSTPVCSDLLGSRQGIATVSVAAGQQILTLVYGSSVTDMHLLTGPIAP